MDYKKICNKHLAVMSDDLQNAGLPMHETADLMVAICKVIEKHLEEENNETN